MIHYSYAKVRQFFDLAIEIFGVTHDSSLCGFILPDGTMLNFSYGHYQRDRDHRDINELWVTLDYDNLPSGTDAMIAFEHMGAIRFSQYGKGINLTLGTYQYPTWQQREAIRLAGNECEVAFDIYDESENRIHSNIIDFAWGNWIESIMSTLEENR